VSVNKKKEKQDQRRVAEFCGEESCLRDRVNFIYREVRTSRTRVSRHACTPAQGRSLPWAMVALLTFTLASLLFKMHRTRGSLGCNKGRHS